MIYLSSTTSIPEKYLDYFGFMLHSNQIVNTMYKQVKEQKRPWMLDNGAFQNAGFDTARWLETLLKYKKFIPQCIAVVLPDKVGNALETLRLFTYYHRIPKDLGYPIAFVSQDGITPLMTPWDYFDVLFIGGSDEHKLGREAGIMIAEAKARKKWIHVGRVNSPARISQFWHVNSVDGTHINFEPDKASKEIACAIKNVNAKKENKPLFIIEEF